MATLGHVAVGVVAARWRASRPEVPPLAFSMLGLSALAVGAHMLSERGLSVLFTEAVLFLPALGLRLLAEGASSFGGVSSHVSAGGSHRRSAVRRRRSRAPGG